MPPDIVGQIAAPQRSMSSLGNHHLSQGCWPPWLWDRTQVAYVIIFGVIVRTVTPDDNAQKATRWGRLPDRLQQPTFRSRTANRVVPVAPHSRCWSGLHTGLGLGCSHSSNRMIRWSLDSPMDFGKSHCSEVALADRQPIVRRHM
jgi:hypothetical protein